MVDNSLVSVIVPTYNVDGFIEKCIFSILNQSYKNIEIIICDDCSSDKTYDTCKKIAALDKRIVLVRNEFNRGVSYTRNRALEIAKGEFICFVDGDDVLDTGCIFKLISIFDFDCCFSEGRLTTIKSQFLDACNNNYVINSENCALYLSKFLRWETSLSCCGKLFKRSLIASLRFLENKRINEDRYFLFQYLINNLNKKVVYSSEIVYGVLERKGSSGRSGFSEKYKDMYFFSKCILDEAIDTSFFEDAVFNDIVTNLMFLKYIIRSKKYRDNNVIFNERKKYILLEYKKYHVRLGLRRFELLALKLGNPFYIIYVKTITKIMRRMTY